MYRTSKDDLEHLNIALTVLFSADKASVLWGTELEQKQPRLILFVDNSLLSGEKNQN